MPYVFIDDGYPEASDYDTNFYWYDDAESVGRILNDARISETCRNADKFLAGGRSKASKKDFRRANDAGSLRVLSFLQSVFTRRTYATRSSA